MRSSHCSALALAAIVLVAIVLVPRRCRADETSAFTLDWSAPPDCPDAEQVRSEVRRFLGSQSASADDKHVEASATVRYDGSSWRVDLVTEIARWKGSRTFFGESCRSVASAAALMVALTVNPRKVAAYRARGEPPPTPPPKAKPEERSEPPPS
jgi:hypothetical protein